MLNTGKLAGKTLYISGASRGIGKAIALKAAQDGAKIVVAAKTAQPHAKLAGTIYTAAEESKLNPTTAFMSGKLKMEGNLGKALALEKIMKKMNQRGYHTSARLANFNGSVPRRHYSTEGPEFSNLDAVFERISSVKSAEMVKKVNASFVFDVEGDKYHIDFSAGSGDGAAGAGNIPGKPDDFKPDVKITISKENCLKLFNRELQPATAFMTGKLKLSGDLAKALSLEAVMKASREARLAKEAADGKRSYHTSARRETFVYTSVADVRERIQNVATPKVVQDVQAIYLFDVDDQGKFYVDFKNASGMVGEGEPPVDKKPDVTIRLSSDIFVKIFNREIAPATAFMSGKVKISGDLTKALLMEKIMKAAREAEEKRMAKKSS